MNNLFKIIILKEIKFPVVYLYESTIQSLRYCFWMQRHEAKRCRIVLRPHLLVLDICKLNRRICLHCPQARFPLLSLGRQRKLQNKSTWGDWSMVTKKISRREHTWQRGRCHIRLLKLQRLSSFVHILPTSIRYVR